MAHRIEIIYKVPDTRALVRAGQLKKMTFGPKVENVSLVDVYTLDREFTKEQLAQLGEALSNPVVQAFYIDTPAPALSFDWAVEIGYLPGVTDNIGNTTKEMAQDLFRVSFGAEENVYTSQISYIKGALTAEEARAVGEALANPLIQRIHVKSAAQCTQDKGMDTIVPKVKPSHAPGVSEVDLDVSDEELAAIGKQGVQSKDGTRRGPLALDLESMKIIRDYFKALQRKPTDLEIESLAQTWSEHCKHTIFAASMDDIQDGIYKYFIRRATGDIRKKRGAEDFCVSVFKDNSGAIDFDENWLITDKVETHNSPSALDPFGGAITGIVGVNRDTIGFGKGAKPVLNRYGFCFADPFDEEPLYKDAALSQKLLSPRRIMEGVIAGVNSGGNCSGIPTPQGFMCFEPRYKGKPLVFVGTVGLIPKKIGTENSWEKEARPGDKVVVIGGRVGQDGIHGATFSSESLSAGSPSTAVQIGDPITQKKLSDAVVKEARDLDLYTSITDNGAGGLSCSVAEMAKESNGCFVDLDSVPLKYPGLDPWQIWISESQERMTLSVPPEKLEAFVDLMHRRGVEVTVIGDFNDSGRCVVQYQGKKVMDIDLGFLHDGLPQRSLKSTYTKVRHEEPADACPADLGPVLLKMMGRLNIASFDFVSYQYDHVVQGETILGPLHGKGHVNSRASVIAPVLSSHKGVVVSQALNPLYSDIDTYAMAACAIDSAVRNSLSVGGSLKELALLDNFCWCSSNEEERLGQLKAAAQACYDTAVAYGTPFISGKDSMFNDFNGYNAKGEKVKISVPPTLLVSTIGVVEDYRRCVSLDLKLPGDLLYVLGTTADEMGGSEYYSMLGFRGNSVPHVEIASALKLYQAFEAALQEGLLASAESVVLGGLGVSLARTAIAGRTGIEVDISKVPQTAPLRNGHLLFSESQSRLLVSVAPSNQAAFEKHFQGLPCALIGKVLSDSRFTIKDAAGNKVVETNVSELEKSYRSTFKGF
ncbi:MAG: AIR synthase-related protein [Candidatus Gracilibacteria bacterium]